MNPLKIIPVNGVRLRRPEEFTEVSAEDVGSYELELYADNTLLYIISGSHDIPTTLKHITTNEESEF
jgi:hypothetical protein